MNPPLPIAPELPALVSAKMTVPLPVRPETVPPMVNVAGAGGGLGGVGLGGGLPLLHAARVRSVAQLTNARMLVAVFIGSPKRLNSASCWGNAQTVGQSPHDRKVKLTSVMAANKLIRTEKYAVGLVERQPRHL